MTSTTWPAYGVIMCMHCKGFLETWHFVWSTKIFHSFAVFFRHLCMFTSNSSKVGVQVVRGIHAKFLYIQLSLCHILKHLEDKKAWDVHIYYTWCDIILIFKLHRRTPLMPRSFIHSLKIRMTSHPCYIYEHTTLSYLLSVKSTIKTMVSWLGANSQKWVIIAIRFALEMYMIFLLLLPTKNSIF